MKTLSDFIKKTIIENNNIHDGLLSEHFYMHFKILDNPFNYINEKYGTYNGQIEFIKAIAYGLSQDLKKGNNIKYNIKKEDLEEAGFENIFFKEININVSNDYSESSFIDKVSFDRKEKLFDSITINISEDDAKNNLLSTLIHELTHAWEEYGRYINDCPVKLSDLTSKNSKYSNLINKKSENDGSQKCKVILYLLTKFEKNAYLSELSTVLEKDGLEIKDYNDALKHFKETDVWINYESALYTIENLNKEEQEDFKNYYNKVNSTNLTFNKIQKKLLNQCKKIFNKISTLIPKIYYEWYTNNKVEESKITRVSYNILEESLHPDKYYKKIENIIKKSYI